MAWYDATVCRHMRSILILSSHYVRVTGEMNKTHGYMLCIYYVDKLYAAVCDI